MLDERNTDIELVARMRRGMRPGDHCVYSSCMIGMLMFMTAIHGILAGFREEGSPLETNSEFTLNVR